MTQTRPTLLILALAAAIAGCTTPPTKTSQNGTAASTPPYKGGGYYKDDGPGTNPPDNLHEVPDAIPRDEPLHRFANNRYKVMGREYVPIASNQGYKARGLASWYGRRYHGKATSSGELYDMYAMTAAHATLPLPSYARVTNLENGKSVVVRVNDRGPFHEGRIIDLSYTAAYKLDVLKGVTPVEVESVLPDEAPTSFSAQAGDNAAPAANPVAATAEALETARLDTALPKPEFTSNGNAVYLQLGAYANPDTADGVMARASAKLSRDFPAVMRIEANGLYKVQAGPFASTEAADRAAAQVLADLGIKAHKVVAGTTTTPVATVTPAPEAVAVAPAPLQAAAAPVAATEVPASPGIYLQLGALSTSDAAIALSNRVINRFGAELPGLSQVNAGSLIKVQAGPFASQADADRLALAYQQDFGVKPYKVVR